MRRPSAPRGADRRCRGTSLRCCDRSAGDSSPVTTAAGPEDAQDRPLRGPLHARPSLFPPPFNVLPSAARWHRPPHRHWFHRCPCRTGRRPDSPRSAGRSPPETPVPTASKRLRTAKGIAHDAGSASQHCARPPFPFGNVWAAHHHWSEPHTAALPPGAAPQRGRCPDVRADRQGPRAAATPPGRHSGPLQWRAPVQGPPAARRGAAAHLPPAVPSAPSPSRGASGAPSTRARGTSGTGSTGSRSAPNAPSGTAGRAGATGPSRR